MTDTQVTWLTEEAYDRLKLELEQLIANRPVIAAEINDRREEGDLRENGGYHAAREDQGQQEARIRQLQELLNNAKVGEAPTESGVALPGSVVTVKFDDGETETFLIGTLIFVKGEGVVLNEPSVAAVDSAGNILGIGLEAKRMLGRTPEGITAVRPMKDGVIADFHIAEKMLRHFLRLVIDRTFLRVKPTVVVCVPSGITEVERRAVRDSAQSAGVKRLYMVSEPMAAAIGVGLPVETPVGSMVIDIGGGTTNIAVIALSGIVCDASIRTGGDELDQAIVQFMRKTYSLLIGEPTAERIKIGLGSATQLEREGEMDVKGRDLVSGLPKTIRIDSAGVRDAIQEPVSHIVNAVRRALEMTPPELASDVLEHGIMLTGGGSLIRGLDQRLMDETGLPVRIDEDPLTSVVRGTGRILDDFTRYGTVLST